MLSEAVVAAIDAEAGAMVEGTGQPGLALAVTDREQTLLVRTYGLADVGAGLPVVPGTLFEIGSIGKSFTAVLALQFADEGRLDLAAPVERYLPWFRVPQPAGSGAVTIAHLLSHTAGIVAGGDGTPEAAFQVWALRDLPARSAPGERFHYSNVGYKAVGLVLEAIAGRSYPELLRERILGRLGMAASEPAITHDVRGRLAVGYEYLRDDRLGHPGAVLAAATWLETDTADGSIASTAEDMCAFARLLLGGGEAPGGRLLSERAFAQMTSAHSGTDESGAYGYGLEIRTLGGRRLIGHGGGMVGYVAGLQADREAGIGAVVLANGPAAHPIALARTAIGIACEEPTRTAPVSIPEVRPIPTGPYRAVDGTGGVIELLDGGARGPRLRADGREIALHGYSDDVFVVADPGWDRFPLEIADAPGATELWHGDRRYVLISAGTAAAAEPPAALRAIAGHYRSHNPWATNFRVVLRGERAWLIFAAAPDGFDDTQPLIPTRDGEFRCGEDPGNPETLRFDTVVDGRTLRAWLSGWPYYRVG